MPTATAASCPQYGRRPVVLRFSAGPEISSRPWARPWRARNGPLGQTGRVDGVRVAAALGLGRVRECRAVTGGVMNLSWRLTTDAGTFAVKRLRDRTAGEIRVVNELLPRLALAGFPVPTPRGDPVR